MVPDVPDGTFTVLLQKQVVIEGNVPYVGRFPTIGSLPKGALKKVESVNGWPSLIFVKPGFSTSDCNKNNSVIFLAAGGKLSANNMKELFGSETPPLPIRFVACSGPAQMLFNKIPLNISYEESASSAGAAQIEAQGLQQDEAEVDRNKLKQ